jgi:peptidyl-prolyl cis-trans isomerase C
MTLEHRSVFIILILAAALVVTGCPKRAPDAGAVSPAQAVTQPAKNAVIVAKVNGVGLSDHELRKMMDRINLISHDTSTAEPAEAIRKRALDQLVLQELAIQEARRQGLSIRPSDIDTAIIYLAGHDPKDYEAFLDKQKMSDAELRSELERGMLVKLIFTREVIQKISVSDDEVRKEYESHKDRAIAPEKITVDDVVLSAKPGDQTARKKAADLIAQMKADKRKNLRDLARNSALTVEGRTLAKDKEPALYDAARKLKQGELSGVIETGDSLHLLQLTGYTPERKLSYEEVKSVLEGKLKGEKLLKRRVAWEQELKKGAKIELLNVPEGPGQKEP